MKIRLVFDDWHRRGKSIYNTEEGVELSMGNFHSGTTFHGTINLSNEDKKELKNAINKGFQPVFWVTL